MTGRVWNLCVVIIIVLATGCASAPKPDASEHIPADPMAKMLDEGIRQLQANIDGATEHIAALERIPETSDPILQELRALDLSGSRLHRQQWMLQHQHLLFAQEQLQQASGHPYERGTIAQQWLRHEQDYETALDELRKERWGIERTRLRTEAKLIERSLQ